MRRYRDLSLQAKFAVQISGSIILLFFVLVPAVVHLQTHLVMEDARQRGLQITKVFAHASVQAVAADDFLLMRHIVNSIASEPDVLYVMIQDVRGRLLTHSNIRESGRILTDPPSLKALQSTGSLVQELRLPAGFAYDFSVPVYVLNDRRAVARVGISLERELGGIRRTRNAIVVAALLTLAAGLFVALLQARAVIRPIDQLVRASQEISNGNLERRIPVEGQDEVGHLAETFNNMAESLRVRFEVDRELSSTLNLEAVLSSLVRHAQRLAVSDLAYIAYRRPDEAVATVAACAGNVGEAIRRWRIQPGHVGAGAALAAGEATTQRNLAQNGETDEANIIREEGLQTWILVPIQVRGACLGLLGAGYRVQTENTTAKQETLQRLADQAAVAIANALAYREIEELTRTLEAKVAVRTLELSDANKQLEASHEKLRELDRLKSDFVSNVSHELRTPLATIRVSVENLLDGLAGDVNPILQRSLTRVKDNTDRLTRLITDLLDLSRIESGRVEVHLAPVPVLPVIQDVLEGFRGMAAQKGLLVAHAPDCQPVVAMADRDKLHQVLVNLVGNAVKFTPAGGAVRVSARRVDQSTSRDVDSSVPIDELTTRRIDSSTEWAEIAVTDTGEGIPPDELAAIFDKFYQVRTNGRGKTPGTGLGLAIAKSLVELQRGRIWAESEVGRGSRFVFTLPLAEASLAADPAPESKGHA